jgi:hypothetical protein
MDGYVLEGVFGTGMSIIHEKVEIPSSGFTEAAFRSDKSTDNMLNCKSSYSARRSAKKSERESLEVHNHLLALSLLFISEHAQQHQEPHAQLPPPIMSDINRLYPELLLARFSPPLRHFMPTTVVQLAIHNCKAYGSGHA